jgi:hypothetical protein
MLAFWRLMVIRNRGYADADAFLNTSHLAPSDNRSTIGAGGRMASDVAPLEHKGPLKGRRKTDLTLTSLVME